MVPLPFPPALAPEPIAVFAASLPVELDAAIKTPCRRQHQSQYFAKIPRQTPVRRCRWRYSRHHPLRMRLQRFLRRYYSRHRWYRRRSCGCVCVRTTGKIGTDAAGICGSCALARAAGICTDELRRGVARRQQGACANHQHRANQPTRRLCAKKSASQDPTARFLWGRWTTIELALSIHKHAR
jgi:hypothetical protein